MKRILIIEVLTCLTSVIVFGQTNIFPPSGPVGIGTLAPVSLVHIQGMDSITPNWRLSKEFSFPSHGMIYEFSNENDFLYLRSKSWVIHPVSPLDDFISFDGINKRFGLGVNNPLSSFQIGDRYSLVETRNSEKAVSYNAYSNPNIAYYKLVDEPSSALRFNLAGDIFLSTHRDGLTGDLIVWNDAITILNSGNVGIGKTPGQTEKLDVNGKIKTTAFQLTATNASGKLLQSGADGTASWVSPAWTLGTNNNIFRIAGNVGIGTSMPIEKLEVTGNIKVNPANKIIASRIDACGAEGLKLCNAAGNGIFVNQNGNIGIGTPSPSTLFEIYDLAEYETKNFLAINNDGKIAGGVTTIGKTQGNGPVIEQKAASVIFPDNQNYPTLTFRQTTHGGDIGLKLQTWEVFNSGTSTYSIYSNLESPSGALYLQSKDNIIFKTLPEGETDYVTKMSLEKNGDFHITP